MAKAILQCSPLSTNGKQQSFFLLCFSKGPGQQLVAFAWLQTSVAARLQVVQGGGADCVACVHDGEGAPFIPRLIGYL